MFGRTLIIIVLGFAVLVGTSYYFLKDETAGNIPPEYQMAGESERIILVNDLPLTVEIADEPHEQAQGLSDRTGLAEGSGMLFVFERAGIRSFWMKDMHFALDILWIDENGIIIDITKNVSPDTFPQTFGPASPALYVLEVNAGWSDRNNVKAGDMIRF